LLVDELIALKPDVLVGDANTARVMRAKTTSIPIVLAASIDPVGDGLAHSLRQPGMNVTGVVLFLDQLSAKHIDIMREILPRITRVGLIFDTTSENCKVMLSGSMGRRTSWPVRRGTNGAVTMANLLPLGTRSIRATLHCVKEPGNFSPPRSAGRALEMRRQIARHGWWN
jgi:ABC transporter substrate binding protein